MLHRLNELVTQMEQKEKATETGLQALERDLTVKQQVLEAHRKKVSIYFYSLLLDCQGCKHVYLLVSITSSN